MISWTQNNVIYPNSFRVIKHGGLDSLFIPEMISLSPRKRYFRAYRLQKLHFKNDKSRFLSGPRKIVFQNHTIICGFGLILG